MNSRMERYVDSSVEEIQESRINKNKQLYNEINNLELSTVRATKNYRIIGDEPKEIDIEKIKKYIESLNVEKEERKRINIFSNIEKEEIIEEAPKKYDLNSIIEEARNKKENNYEADRYKKIENDQYDILDKIKLYDKKEEIEKEKEEKFNTDERTLINLINTISIKKESLKEGNLLDELTKGSENTVILPPIDEVKEKPLAKLIEEPFTSEKNKKEEKISETKSNLKAIDKSFYTNSLSFSKEDFDGIDDIEKKVTKNNAWFVISIIFLVILILGVLTIILNYALDLKLF